MITGSAECFDLNQNHQVETVCSLLSADLMARTSCESGFRADGRMNQQIDLMSDTDCTAFLQWALPCLNLRWPGFRKVRRQVCKRLKRRRSDLQLTDFVAYRTRLEADPSEWQILEPIDHRDRCEQDNAHTSAEGVFRAVEPKGIAAASREASPRSGRPVALRTHREGIDFLFQDLRLEAPDLLFDLILCRYVAFTYFAVPLQYQVLGRIVERLLPNGYLVIGTHERLLGDVATLAPLAGRPANLPENGGATRLKAWPLLSQNAGYPPSGAPSSLCRRSVHYFASALI